MVFCSFCDTKLLSSPNENHVTEICFKFKGRKNLSPTCSRTSTTRWSPLRSRWDNFFFMLYIISPSFVPKVLVVNVHEHDRWYPERKSWKFKTTWTVGTNARDDGRHVASITTMSLQYYGLAGKYFFRIIFLFYPQYYQSISQVIFLFPLVCVCVCMCVCTSTELDWEII